MFADGFIGAEAGFGINWMSRETPSDGTGRMDMSTMSFTIGISGAHYFTDNIGLGYGLGMDFPFLVKWGEFDFQENLSEQKAIKGDISFQFKHDFSRKFALEAGLGMYVFYSWTSEDWSVWQFGAQGNVGISYRIISSLALRTGMRIYTPFDSSAKSGDIKYEWNEKGVGLIPYIGLAFAY